MAVTVIATAKSATANSYVTLAETDTYFEGRLNATGWSGAATDDIKNRAIVMSTGRLEQEDYSSSVTDINQALKWPRNGITDEDGRIIDQDTVPKRIKEACQELALELLNDGVALKDTGLEGFENVKIGSLDVTPRLSRIAGTLPANVRRLLKLWRIGASELTVHVTRA